MFVLENFTYAFCRQLVRVITLQPPTELTHEPPVFMIMYKQLLQERYGDTVFLLRQISKQHSKFNHMWNHVSDHPKVKNDTTSRHQ